MSAYAEARRGRTISRLVFITALAAALAFAVVSHDRSARRGEVVRGLALPMLAQELNAAAIVHVATREDEFRVERRGDDWLVTARADHPADPAMVAGFLGGLADMTLAEPKTSDPGRHHRLGLDDPAVAGDGARVEVRDAAGRALATLIVGNERPGGEGYYVRFRAADGDGAYADQTYAVAAELPRFRAAADWIDLEFLRTIARDEIVAVDITPESGARYSLSRASGRAGEFGLAEPASGWALTTPGAGSTVAGATGRLRFRDARLADELTEPPVGRHELVAADGLRVALDLYADGEARWAAVTAYADQTAEDGGAAAAARAAALNAITEGWAYLVPPYAAERLVRALDQVAQPADEG